MAESEGNLTAARTRSNELEAKLGAAPSELFARLFPDIQGCTEEKAALHISTLNSSVPAGDEVEKLEGQVEHYKGVLAQTESMLTSLQASVKSAESEWRVKLDASIKGLADARGQATSLAEKAAALEQEVAQSAQAGEMQGQLAALQAQLLGQEAEKQEVGVRAASFLSDRSRWASNQRLEREVGESTER